MTAGESDEQLAERLAAAAGAILLDLRARGDLAGKALGQAGDQQANAIKKFRAINKDLAGLQIRQAMVGRWFFMIIGTIFSITPAPDIVREG